MEDTSHINPDRTFAGGTRKVDLKDLPWLHIYSQPCEHFDARIVGNRKALEMLLKTIEITIAHGSGEADLGEVCNEEVFATDGEGYTIKVTVLPDSPKKDVATPNAWEDYPPHYCDPFGHMDGTRASALRKLADEVEKLEEQISI